jgi:type I restriction enzyme M protein
MLDTDTKRRIDTARDILVGKVPDPKSQVEQITIALIYKFMDDMDAESEEFGGKRKFFAGEFARYGWAKLMRSGLGGHETLNLYAEAIAKMPENPGIPLLFRDIFKNAYLPYRDPETLKMFLKVIDEFSYDHSERLGDAFEYLLSVLGSQGDAGQFRTPRHIIDFMVEIVDPKKTETVLDPACGTAGFLISSWKHILKDNTNKKGQSTLTPDEKGRLAQNFKGYDISPDMVRLSLVNMYLHGFADPHIAEYDTLTSQDRWNEYADVILANPPFMSPKGGIKPHNRFSVQSKRSEVLFVDYMAEHLTPQGRAGIIVPEGIIFQSGSAYVQLREMLIRESLIGVISLPSGVFQPYTAVKTSILILDKYLAKRNPRILFCDVRHIGMSLGIKRTLTEKNDLPHVIKDFRAYYSGSQTSTHSWMVDRDAVLANGCNLTGERYRPISVTGETRSARLGDICLFTKGTSSSTKTESGPYPLIVRGEENLTSLTYQFEEAAVCIPLLSLAHGRGQIKRIHYAPGRFALANLLTAVQPNDLDELDTRYLYLVLDYKKDNIAALMEGAIYVTLKIEDLAEFHIPLPPLEVQQEIVAEIEGYQKVINGARQVVDNWKPQIEIDPDWPRAEVGEILEIGSGGTPSKNSREYWQNGDIPWYSSGELNDIYTKDPNSMITASGLQNSHATIFPKGSLLVGMYDTAAFKMSILDRDAAFNQAVCGIKPNPKVDLYFLYLYFSSKREEYLLHRVGVRQRNLNKGFIESIEIPVPSLDIQHAIVTEIEAEQTLVNANRELIARFEKKIQTILARVWGEEEPVSTEA